MLWWTQRVTQCGSAAASDVYNRHGVAFAMAAELNLGRVNLLKCDKMEKSYYPVKIGLRGGGIENLNPDEEIRR